MQLGEHGSVHLEHCDDSLPEEHLFEHAVGGGDPWETPGGQSMELQVRGDDLCGHLSVRRGTGSTTTTQQDKEIVSKQNHWMSSIVNNKNASFALLCVCTH